MTYGAAHWAQHAHADLPLLSWSAPADCPDSSVVRQRIAAWLSKPDATTGPDAAVRADGVVTRNRRGIYKLTLTVTEDGVSGTRRLSGRDCRQLSETAAFLIAVATDPNAGASGQPAPLVATEPPAVPEPEAKPAPTPPREPARTPPSEQVKAPTSKGLWSIHGAGFGGIWQDKLPSLQPLVGGSAGAAYGIWQTEFRGAFAFQREKHFDSLSGPGKGRARAFTQSYGWAACALWPIGSRVRVGPCGTVSLLRTDARSDGVRDGERAHKLWSVFALGPQISVELVRQLELFGEGGASVPLSRRPDFRVDETEVLTAARIAYYGWLGARIRWGLTPRGRP